MRPSPRSEASRIARLASYHLVVRPDDAATWVHWLIEYAIHADLGYKGYTSVGPTRADFVVAYDIAGEGPVALDSTREDEASICIVVSDAKAARELWRAEGSCPPLELRFAASLKRVLRELLGPIPPRRASLQARE